MTASLVAPYAAALGVLMILLSFWVSLARASAGISLETGGNPVLTERVRAFGNFAEWAPMALLLLVLAETAGAPAWALHFGGTALVVGRVLHPFGLSTRQIFTPLRFLGMALTYATIAVAAYHLVRAATAV